MTEGAHGKSMNRSQPVPRVFPAGLAALAVVMLAGVAAATSHASVWSPPRDGVGYASELLTIVAVSFVVTFAVAGALVPWLGRSREIEIRWRRTLPGTIILAVAVSLMGISRAELHLEGPASGAERIDDSDSGRLGTRLRMDWRGPAVRNGGEESRGTEAVLPVSRGRALFARLLLALAGVAALTLVMRMRRSGRGGHGASDWRGHGRDDDVRTAAHAAIVRSIDAMLADPDDRTAIIGAYARLLEELQELGANRRPYEGPTEHLRRVLAELEIGPEPLRTLVQLFEVARFSERSLTTAHRHEALAALRTAAGSLAASKGSRSSSRRVTEATE